MRTRELKQTSPCRPFEVEDDLADQTPATLQNRYPDRIPGCLGRSELALPAVAGYTRSLGEARFTRRTERARYRLNKDKRRYAVFPGIFPILVAKGTEAWRFFGRRG